MTHYAGHIPNGSLMLTDLLNDNGDLHPAPSIHVHGYLYPSHKGKAQKHYKIIFINNNNIPLAPKQKVGYHLQWFSSGVKGKKIGIAYDIVDWEEHEVVETAVVDSVGGGVRRPKKLQAIANRKMAGEFIALSKAKKIEHFPPETLQRIINDLRGPRKKLKHLLYGQPQLSRFKEKTKGIKLAATILEQSAGYMSSPFFDKKTRASRSFPWIQKTIKNFSTQAGIFS